MTVSLFAISSSAISAEDWEVVGAAKDSATLTKVGTSLVLESEGWYPSDNAGLLYKNALDLSTGIEINITLVDPPADDDSDAWHGIFMLNNPVYFNTGASSSSDGYGIVLLCRTRGFEWVVLDDSGFNVVAIEDSSSYSDKDYFAENVEITFKVILEGDELNVYVDGVKVDYDFSSLLEYFTDNKGYIGYSTSSSDQQKQILKVNYLNGEPAAASGDVTTVDKSDQTTAEVIDYDSVSEFKFIDFTKEESLKLLSGANSLTSEYDTEKGCLKLTINGDDPYVYFTINKSQYFPGDKFTVCKIEAMSDYEGGCEFYFVSKESPAIGSNNVQGDFEASENFMIHEFDMDDNGGWASEIRTFRFDPMTGSGSGEVFYIKSVSFAEYVPPATTTKDPSLTTEAPETDAPGTTSAAPEATDSVTVKPTDSTTTAGSGNAGNSNVGLIIGIIAAVVVVAVVIVVVVITKKKKK